MSAGPARVATINVGVPRTVDRNGQPATTAIWKAPIDGPVEARGVNLVGDDQADRRVHGGVDKAVYAYAVEDRHWWEGELGRTLDAGGFGENLSTEGVDLTGAVIGTRWRIGTATFEVSEPRVPCWKLNLRMDDNRFIQRFTAAGRPGAYLRIVGEGSLQAGDEIVVDQVPDHGVTVGHVAGLYADRNRDRGRVERLLEVPELSDAWKEWATSSLDR